MTRVSFPPGRAERGPGMTRLDREALRALARRIEADLRAAGDRERRDFTSGYFPTRLEILGVKAAIGHKIIRECHKELRHQQGRTIVDLAQELVRGKTHEGRGVGHGLLSRREDALRLLNEKALRGRGNFSPTCGLGVGRAASAPLNHHNRSRVMRKSWTLRAVVCASALVAASSLLGSAPLVGQEEHAHMGHDQTGESGIRAEMLEDLSGVAGKMAGLAEAIPQSSYSYRPMEGVRSASEVFMHLAAANYMLPSLIGTPVPEEAGFTMETMGEYEKIASP